MKGGIEVIDRIISGFDEDDIQAAAAAGGVDPSILSDRRREDLDDTRQSDSILRREFLAFDGDFRAEILADEGGLNVNLLATLDRPGNGALDLYTEARRRLNALAATSKA